MKKLLAFIVMAAILTCPVLASGEPAEAPAAVAEDAVHHVTVEVTKEATCGENGLLTYFYDGEAYMTVETVATGKHTPSADAATCTEPVICTVCGAVLEPVASHAYTYQYDAVQNADGTFSSFGTWKCDNCGATLPATEGNAVYYYGLLETEAAAPAALPTPAGEASGEPAVEESPAQEEAPITEGSGDLAANAEATPVDATPAAITETPTEGETSEEPAPAATELANPNYDPAAYNWGAIEITMAVIIVLVFVVLMLSFGKNKSAKKKED